MLTARRRTAAADLDAAVADELPPLKLEKARFATAVEALAEGDWGPTGADRVQFRVATNPGAAPGPIGKIASGGELARFMLALKVVLAEARRSGSGSVPTLVFDEVDSGISGATAAAVGERLSRLGQRVQVLVVTHSPQVAARAGHHWRVQKAAEAEHVSTTVVGLDDRARREEIARMLAGATVTDQARAAADSLLAGEG
jgi:DNA repair protein RecN (Recombination protein N)